MSVGCGVRRVVGGGGVGGDGKMAGVSAGWWVSGNYGGCEVRSCGRNW